MNKKVEIEWISVNERFPEDGTMVLVTDCEFIELAYWDIKKKYWRTDFPICYGKIHYWAKLPEMPYNVNEIKNEINKIKNKINEYF